METLGPNRVFTVNNIAKQLLLVLRVIYMTRTITIGLVQLEAVNNKYENIEKVKKLMKSSRNIEADIIVLPEYLMTPIEGLEPHDLYEIAEDINDAFINKLAAIAKEYSTNIIATFFEKTNKPPRVYNTVVLIRSNGEAEIVYRKTHLFDAYGYKESNYMMPGPKPSKVIDVNKVRIAFSVCFDIRFPELYRVYSLNGAEIIVSPSAWYKGPLKEETLRFLAQARAHENTVYMVIANQTGKYFTGRSMIIDPLGTVLIDLGINETYKEYTIDVDYIYEVRRKLPVLKLRRPELYKTTMT